MPLLLLIVLGATAAALGAYLGLCGHVVTVLLRAARTPLLGSPADLGLEYETVTFPSRQDRLALRGWLLPAAEPRGWVIIIHGQGGNRGSSVLLRMALDLQALGYGTLLLDLRGHGESAGERLSLGYYERHDVLGAVDFLASRGVPRERIVLLGFSLGAAAALLAAKLEPDVAGVISDSSFAELSGIIQREARRRSGLPGLFTPGIILMGQVLHGVRLSEVKPVDAVKQLSFPVLLIHGALDEVIGPSHSRRLWEATRNRRSRLWVVPGACHGQTYTIAPGDYMKRVASYLAEVEGAHPNRPSKKKGADEGF
ncbi:MAG: alpha/beta hydrolase [Chloroflexi bacterium]|nr:alpha/beta hydrolase [Chloroflexota bacterium]